jgi:hypothetical protein
MSGVPGGVPGGRACTPLELGGGDTLEEWRNMSAVPIRDGESGWTGAHALGVQIGRTGPIRAHLCAERRPLRTAPLLQQRGKYGRCTAAVHHTANAPIKKEVAITERPLCHLHETKARAVLCAPLARWVKGITSKVK